MNKIERVRVLGIPVDVVDMETSISKIDDWISSDFRGNYICAVNPEKVDILRKNDQLKSIFEKASLLIPDGIGVVMAIRLLYGKKIGRVPGSDLMPRLCAESVKKGYKIFIYGSKEEVSRQAVESLQQKHPGIRIVGRCNGFLKENEMPDLINRINRSEADILFVALGSPKQEIWMKNYLPQLKVKICQGVGGTLDTITGNVKRAPVFFQKMGLEWFFRLLREPSRISRQMILPKFALQVLKEKVKMIGGR